MPENYTLLLGDDGSVSIQADCNQGGGTYARSGSELSFTPIATTLMACPEGSQADLYLASLGDVTSFTIEDGDLVLTLSDAGTLRFTAAEVITGVEWQWTEFQSMDGSVITVDTPENYTLLLGDDGSASVRADCNRGSGAYTLEDSQISFGAMALTQAACPAESLADAYVQYLADVRSYVVEDGELFLSLQMDGGIMRFAQAEA
jgi:heat shock protein HslJ